MILLVYFLQETVFEPNFWLASTHQSIVVNMILKQAASPFDLINLSYLLLVEHVSKTVIHS